MSEQWRRTRSPSPRGAGSTRRCAGPRGAAHVRSSERSTPGGARRRHHLDRLVDAGLDPPGTQRVPGPLLRRGGPSGRPAPPRTYPFGLGAPPAGRVARGGRGDRSGTVGAHRTQRGAALGSSATVDRDGDAPDGTAGSVADVRSHRPGTGDSFARHLSGGARRPVGRAPARDLVRAVPTMSSRLWTKRFRSWTKKGVTPSDPSGGR